MAANATSVRIFQALAPMRDGTLLATDVTCAEGGPRRPALLLRTPYSKAAAAQALDLVGLAQSGWAVVVQDTRGCGSSQGRADLFRQEGPDGADAVAWCASQPWCDGRVAMTGGSYCGWAQWAAASRAPEALRVISPSVCSPRLADGWRDGGALSLGLVTTWSASMAAGDPRLPARQRARAAELATNWQRTLEMPLPGHPLRKLLPAYDRWLSGDAAYWADLDLAKYYRRVRTPAYQVAGWYDLFCEGALHSWSGLRSHAATETARSGQRLVVGPWTHTTLFQRLSAGMDFGPSASRQALPQEILQWMWAAVAGRPVAGGLTVFVMGTGEWRDLTDWPPPAEDLKLYLHAERGANSLRGDGQLTAVRPERSGTDRFCYDPHRPVATYGGRILGPWLPLPGPIDQRPVEDRDDVLVYSSAPLDRDLSVIGEASCAVTFETTGRTADVTVKLVDVHPDGVAYNVLDSIRRADFEPGRPKVIRVRLGSVAQAFLAGHRIRVEVSSSNFPRFDRNPSYPANGNGEQGLRPAIQTLHRGGRANSWLTLPVVD